MRAIRSLGNIVNFLRFILSNGKEDLHQTLHSGFENIYECTVNTLTHSHYSDITEDTL